MKKKEKMLPKIVASVALVAIIIWIVGTGLLVIFESFFSMEQEQALTEEELQKYLETLSGSSLTGWTLTGETTPLVIPMTNTGS